MTIELRIASSEDGKEWDRIIAESPHGTLFHHWDWLKITEKHTRTTLFPLIGIKDGTAIGVFPLFLQKKGIVRMVFSPPPNTSILSLGPVLAGYDALRQEKREINYIGFQNLVDDFICNELKAQYIRISLPPALQDPRPFLWSGYTFELQYDYIVDLSIGPESLFQALGKNGRQNIRRAEKKGISVEVGGKNECEKIIDLMIDRYAEQGKNVTESRQYYSDIYDNFRDYLKIFVARSEGEIISGCIDFHYRGTHFSWIGNPKPKKPISPSPNDLLIWESVRYAHDHGCRYYVTMNAAGDKRLHSYYVSKFNPELKAHFSLKKNSWFAGLLETGYSDMIKPFRGRFRKLFH